jgi:hypothetical protein
MTTLVPADVRPRSQGTIMAGTEMPPHRLQRTDQLAAIRRDR